MRGGEADLAVVDLRDLLDDGQSQAAPPPDVRVQPHEATEPVVATVFRNAGSIVLDLQVDAPVGGLTHPNGDSRTVGTVAQGIVDQVVEDLAEQGRVAFDDEVPGSGFEFEIDPAGERPIHPVAGDIRAEILQDDVVVESATQDFGLDTGEAQQLVRGARRPRSVEMDAVERLAAPIGAGVAPGQLDTGGQRGQRSTQLMRRRLHERLRVSYVSGDPVEQVVQRMNDVLDLFRNLLPYGAQIVG